MARPKKLTNTAAPEQEIEQTETQDPSYSYEEISEKTARELAVDDAQDDEKKGDDTGDEGDTTVVDDEKEKPKTTVEEPDISRVAEETARKVLEEQERLRKEAEEAAKPAPQPNEEYRQIAAKFEEDKGRPPTWDELAEKIEERTLEKLEQRQAERAKAAEDEANAIKAAQEEDQKRINSFVDDELNDLYNAGKLTKIKDPNNPYDQGVVERKALFTAWQQVNTQRRAEGKPDILSATRIFEFYYKKPNAQPAGANAPILGGRSAGTAEETEQEYSYADLKKPWSLFKRR